MKNKLLAVLFGAALVLGACGGDKADEKDDGAATTDDNATASVDAEEVVNAKCITCHGGNLEGAMGPKLSDIGSRMSEDEIHGIIENGTKGGMPAGLIKGEELDAVAKWLSEKK
ncbi:cytochrome c551 [Filibacter tadaridae]|uniref:Cytochrome c-551 n=1 Tax=Filibacter tadaridae TaxID=2483811 RepID=A0A3P5WW24_9BACL|nr:cytochrome c [Filibacter tadaridae]VDC27562.1 Cytochrome c-551 precursor [Filibacter tadaridae]